jgi:hypothetical protein
MLQVTAYVLASFAPPYPIFVSVFTLNGMGFGLQDALANVRDGFIEGGLALVSHSKLRL